MQVVYGEEEAALLFDQYLLVVLLEQEGPSAFVDDIELGVDGDEYLVVEPFVFNQQLLPVGLSPHLHSALLLIDVDGSGVALEQQRQSLSVFLVHPSCRYFFVGLNSFGVEVEGCRQHILDHEYVLQG